MNNMLKRLLALLMAALLGAGCLAGAALAEDWRDLLRDAFGLNEDTGADYDNAGDYADVDNTDEVSGAGESGTGAREYHFDTPITDPQQIVNYLSVYGELPDNFITKSEAKALGWNSSYNYVGEVAPGKSIGGDRFGNYEGQLPSKKGRTWYECDANYKGKKRGADRVLFSSDGLYFFTNDHYNTFTEMFPEELQ